MSTAPVLDERVHVDVLKAAVAANLGDEASCYGYDEVPGTEQHKVEAERSAALPPMFALVSLERRPVTPTRQIGRAGRSSWRLTFRALGRTERECRWVLMRLTEVVDEARFDIGGYRTSPVTHESSTQPTWDDDRFVADRVYTYNL